ISDPIDNPYDLNISTHQTDSLWFNLRLQCSRLLPLLLSHPTPLLPPTTHRLFTTGPGRKKSDSIWVKEFRLCPPSGQCKDIFLGTGTPILRHR
uniref:Uncharacterized protein n=1 Tax=Labrus bergylta TaxID=56723 RepID=A0A3Q3GNS3_9LABR